MLRMFLLFLLLTACGRSEAPPAEPGSRVETKAPVAQPAPDDLAEAPVTPPAPGEPGGLPDDRTPLTEEPAKPGGAQEAATVLETYYALIEAGKYREAWKLRWSKPGDKPDAFVESFGKYETYHANVGAPSQPQGAAGSLYVEVPVQTYGKLKGGKAFSSAGNVTLRRVNKVPGATAEELKWRIYS